MHIEETLRLPTLHYQNEAVNQVYYLQTKLLSGGTIHEAKMNFREQLHLLSKWIYEMPNINCL